MTQAATGEARLRDDAGRVVLRYHDLYPTQPPACAAMMTDGCAPAWAMTVSPTDEEMSRAAVHLERARRARAVSSALGAAEARDCAGVSPGDRDLSPFGHRRDIVGVAAIEGGAAVTFALVPGLTVAALREIVACHLARDAVLEPIGRAPVDCPLAVGGAMARVGNTAGGLVVEVTAAERGAVREILERARALLTQPRSAPLAAKGARWQPPGDVTITRR
jgi:hypothetical protein